jgi:hypothetical protein
MTADAAEADRRREVRMAARGWRRAAAIDDATLAAVVKAYPDDRVRLRPAFRTLAFVFTGLALNAFFLFVMAVFKPDDNGLIGVLAIAFGLFLCVMTEVQVGGFRRSEGGTESATALVGLAYMIGGAALLLFEVARPGEHAALSWTLALAGAALATAAWRWGMPALAALAGVCFFLLLAQGPLPRLFWAVASLMMIPPLVAGGEDARLPPAHRRSLQVMLGLSLVALYVCFHLGSWDNGFIESMRGGGHRLRESSLRPLAKVGTALIPTAVVAFGVFSRRRVFLDVGLALGLASLITMRFYVHVAPMWVVLALGGGAAIAAALALRRFLASAAGGERGGFTAEPLFEDPDRHRPLEVTTALTLGPAARATARGDRSLAPGGGRFGGGGASDEY